SIRRTAQQFVNGLRWYSPRALRGHARASPHLIRMKLDAPLSRRWARSLRLLEKLIEGLHALAFQHSAKLRVGSIPDGKLGPVSLPQRSDLRVSSLPANLPI